MAMFSRFAAALQLALAIGLITVVVSAQNDFVDEEEPKPYSVKPTERLLHNVPETYEAKPVALINGGDRNAGAAYRYKNGYDYTTQKGARLYDKNAGYGWAKETDVAKPNFSQWSRVYSTAQATSWGSKKPALYQTPVTYYR